MSNTARRQWVIHVKGLGFIKAVFPGGDLTWTQDAEEARTFPTPQTAQWFAARTFNRLPASLTIHSLPITDSMHPVGF